MPLLHNYLFDQLLVPAVFVFFLIAALFGLAFGISLIAFRTRAFQSLATMDRWVSARESLAPLEKRREIEPFVYQHRRSFSAVFIIGGLCCAVVISGKVPATGIASMYVVGHPVLDSWIAESLVVVLIAGSILAVVIGVLLGFFPPLLRRFELWTNRWVSSRQIAKGAEDVHLPIDRWFRNSPRTAGILLAVAALLLAINSTVVLLARA